MTAVTAISPFQRATDYTSSWIGILRTTQTIQEGARVANEIRRITHKPPSAALSRVDASLDGSISALMICGIPTAMKGASESISDLKKTTSIGGSIRRATTQVIHDLSDLASMCSATASFLTRLPIFRTLGSLFDITADGTEIGLYGEKYLKSKKLQEKAELESATNIKHTKRYDLLKLMRAVAATAAGIFGLISLATGMTLLPALAFSALTLLAIAFDVTSHFYKITRPKPLIDPFQYSLIN